MARALLGRYQLAVAIGDGPEVSTDVCNTDAECGTPGLLCRRAVRRRDADAPALPPLQGFHSVV